MIDNFIFPPVIFSKKTPLTYLIMNFFWLKVYKVVEKPLNLFLSGKLKEAND